MHRFPALADYFYTACEMKIINIVFTVATNDDII